MLRLILWLSLLLSACGQGPVADTLTVTAGELVGGYRQRLLACDKLPEYRGGAGVCR